MRKLFEAEKPIVKFLLNRANLSVNIDELLVSNMSDGGMGSLFIGENNTLRTFGEKISECSFNGIDGVLVSATLNLDQNGDLFEIDIWKTNFSPLLKWPNESDIVAGAMQ
ncbi:hypothetical protein [Chitinibacter sp. ZOR0017]|uniref:DUF6984 family protein n=1 Tax=Chitinibacter sp. ZOR0017 TaxID=1339254 RepID=UPI0006474BE8|nr:hypothetical protein [Chitinibacter sp. ZOR0017]